MKLNNAFLLLPLYILVAGPSVAQNNGAPVTQEISREIIQNQIAQQNELEGAKAKLQNQKNEAARLLEQKNALEAKIKSDKLPQMNGEKGGVRMMMMQARSGRLYPVFQELKKTQRLLSDSSAAIAQLSLEEFSAYFEMLKSTVSFETQEISLYRYKESVMDDYMAKRISSEEANGKLAAFKTRVLEVQAAVAADAAKSESSTSKVTAEQYIAGLNDQIKSVEAYKERVEVIDGLQNTLVAKELIINSLNATLTALTKELGSVKSELATANETVKQRDTQIADLNSTLNLNLQQYSGGLSNLQNLVTSLRMENRDLKIELAASDKVIALGQEHLKGVRDESEAKSSVFRDFTKERLTFDAEKARKNARRIQESILKDSAPTLEIEILSPISAPVIAPAQAQ